MIRQAKEQDFQQPIFNESALRIHALYEIYGSDVSFVRFFADGEGTLCSVMDGVGICSAGTALSEEWMQFIGMNPDIRTLHCTKPAGESIQSYLGWPMRSGTVMKYGGDIVLSSQDGICTNPSLPAVHALLTTCFADFSPLDAWYPDVSHRIRHGHGHIAAVTDGEKVVSSAMTVAEAGEQAILGQVATAAANRRQGLAGKCLKSLLFTLQGKSLYILPANPPAQKLYEELGFCSCDVWAELQRP